MGTVVAPGMAGPARCGAARQEDGAGLRQRGGHGTAVALTRWAALELLVARGHAQPPPASFLGGFLGKGWGRSSGTDRFLGL